MEAARESMNQSQIGLWSGRKGLLVTYLVKRHKTICWTNDNTVLSLLSLF